ncbi:hypothetical protein [Paraburkholderia sp. MM6662-R1]|uniref:hypothetical protein n=1 Tax=Paraburkholderia sp. MM6662-R1 TaxID=2991066 RepID=UPI003D225AA2
MENQNSPQGQITNIVADSLNINPGVTTENAAPTDVVSETANELLQAALASGSHLEDGIKIPSLEREAGSDGKLTEDEVRALRDKMMRRAAKQREQVRQAWPGRNRVPQSCNSKP